jgi:UDP-glucose 4-epimerase
VTARAIVLGAAGFVGRHVARALAVEGWQVVGIGHGGWSREEWRSWGVSDWHLADIDEEALLSFAGEPDLLVQCAGSGSVAFSMTHPKEDFDRSVGSTLAALEFLRVHVPNCPLVLPSSAAVYGTVHESPICVNAEKSPQSPYGVHKTVVEDLCRSYARTFGLRVAIVRLFSVYGPGLRKQLLWDACSKLHAGMATFAGSGEEERDWLHVEDAATLLLAASRHATENCPIVNGGTGETTSVRRIVEQLDLKLGGQGSFVFTGASREGDPDVYRADIAEALAWGWRPARELQTGLSEYATWFRDDALT